MGAELIERVRQCEAMVRDALAVTEEMKETAARYRVEAKRIFLQIEDCSLVTAEVRKTCNELMEKIAMDSTQKTKRGNAGRPRTTGPSYGSFLNTCATGAGSLPIPQRRAGAPPKQVAPTERAFGDLCKETAR